MKAILVIDMPKSCEECPCWSEDFNSCNFSKTYGETVDCPIKPMPEHKPTDFMNYWFNQGYNALYDELVGDEDE